MLVFSAQLCDLLPTSVVHLTPPPTLPCVKSVLFTRIQCVKGGYGVLGLRQINTYRKVPNFFRWRFFALSSVSLIFLRVYKSRHTGQNSTIRTLEIVYAPLVLVSNLEPEKDICGQDNLLKLIDWTSVFMRQYLYSWSHVQTFSIALLRCHLHISLVVHCSLTISLFISEFLFRHNMHGVTTHWVYSIPPCMSLWLCPRIL